MKAIVKMIFGSHLYGTADESSDKDYKGIFLPSKEQIMLNRISKSITSHTKRDNNSKNTKDDIDTELYSLHYFIHLACEGETVALDMLHAPDDLIIEKDNDIWGFIIKNRHRFYTSNLKAFIGYARRQASKYGIKGSRLNDAKKVLDFCNQYDADIKLKEIWDELPVGEHIFKLLPDINGIRMYEVCGRKMGETTRLSYLKDVVENFYKAYGARAEQAAKNEGIDWKAVSHALRAALQVKQILTEGTITFPLKEANYLRTVKRGLLDYKTIVAPMLDKLMDEVEDLSQKSLLPIKVDRAFWDEAIIMFLTRKIDWYK